jgi:nicotinate-nucleotide adenylyltransferase
MLAARSGCASCAPPSTWWRATATSAPESPPVAGGPRSLGILGGTFNPPHQGHLAIARHARAELSLDQVALMPVGTPPHKPAAPAAAASQRLAMCRLLIEGAEGLSVCALETERHGPSYTVDTVRELHARHPETELTFIVGADVASTLPSWREPQALLELAVCAVAARPGSDRGGLLDALAPLASAERVRFLEAPRLEISSSLARERAAAGRRIDDLVGPAVAGYVAEHGLYRSVASAQVEAVR